MSKYIFHEDEWKQYEDGYTTATMLGIHGEKYGQIKHRMLDSGPGGMPGSSTYGSYLGVNTFGPGGIYESHAHETPMFYYVLEGRALMRVGDEEKIVSKGAWVYTPPQVEHYTENIGETDFAYIIFGGEPLDPNNTTAHSEIERHEDNT